MTVEVYGIKNCNTVKKALSWLDENKIGYNFHDFKKEPATKKKLEEWENFADWTILVNKKGTTWRKLDDSVQSQILDKNSANDILLQYNSMIKRPIIEYKSGLLVGYNEEEYQNNLLK